MLLGDYEYPDVITNLFKNTTIEDLGETEEGEAISIQGNKYHVKNEQVGDDVLNTMTLIEIINPVESKEAADENLAKVLP